MSLFTEDMRLLTAVVIENKSDEVVKALLAIGALDFVKITNLPPDQISKLSDSHPNLEMSAIRDTRRRIDNILRQSQRVLPSSSLLNVEDMVAFNINKYQKIIDQFSASIAKVKDQQKSLNQNFEALNEMKHYLDTKKHEFLEIRVGTAKADLEELREKVSSYSAIVIENANNFTTLSLKRETAHITQVLDMLGWIESEEVEVQKKGAQLVEKELNEQITKIVNEKKELESIINKKIQEKEPTLVKMWCNLRLHELSNQIRSYFKYTKNTTLFSGWVPKKFAKQVENAIFTASEGQCIIDQSDPSNVENVKVPVEVTTPKILKPFEKIVTNYGIPEYNTINPTWFVAIAYLSMFALMFADLGQGFVLLLIGIFTSRSYKNNPMKEDGLISRGIAQLLKYLGVASMVGGILFGSTFGFSLFPAVWFNYHSVVMGTVGIDAPIRSINGILGVTIVYGVVVIYVGLIINWINLIIKKNYIDLVCSRTGFLGAAMYAAGLYFGYAYVKSGFSTFPSDTWVIVVIIIGALGLLIREPLHYFNKRKKGKEVSSIGDMIKNMLMMWPVELLETFTGYMSNTLSFMRVAGLGIAHVSLMGAFETIAEGVGLTSVFGILILVFGNVLVIGLEGLSAGIQSLRLNYYEFFTKFFTGRGIAYSPVSLRSKER